MNKNKNKNKKKNKKTKSRKTQLKIIITTPHWYCLNETDNICDQTSLLNGILLHAMLREELNNKVHLLSPPPLHRTTSDANRSIQGSKLGIYHPSLKPFLSDLKRNLNYKPKLLLDIHSYSQSNNLPFYVIYLDTRDNFAYSEIFVKKICQMMNLNYSPEMIKLGTHDNEILRLSIKYKSVKLALLIELYDGNTDFIRYQLLKAINHVALEFIQQI